MMLSCGVCVLFTYDVDKALYDLRSLYHIIDYMVSLSLSLSVDLMHLSIYLFLLMIYINKYLLLVYYNTLLLLKLLTNTNLTTQFGVLKNCQFYLSLSLSLSMSVGYIIIMILIYLSLSLMNVFYCLYFFIYILVIFDVLGNDGEDELV